MGTLIPAAAIPLNVAQGKYAASFGDPSSRPAVLVATVASSISSSMRELLDLFPVRTIWAKGVDEVRTALSRENIAVCFSGFWLVDGTYRDVVRHLKSQPAEIPAVIVCEPDCPHEYRDYLAALNIRAFDFICHPYRQSDLERILASAISVNSQSAATQSAFRAAV